MRNLLGLLIITTSLFSGCDLVEQFLAENKDAFSKVAVQNFSSSKNSVHQDGVFNSPKVKLPQGMNNGIASNISSYDNLVPGWYKISGFAGGKTLKGIQEETHNFSVDFSEDSLPGMSRQSSSLVSEEEYYSNNIYFSENSYNSISGLSGQSGSLISIEEDYAEIKAGDKRSKVKEYFKKLETRLIDIKGELKGEVNGVIDNLIAFVEKLANATGDDKISIGEISDSSTKASKTSNRDSVKAVVEGIKGIVEIAEASGLKIENKDIVDDIPVSASDNTVAPAALNGGSGRNFKDGGAGVGSGVKLAEAVYKANAWAMIDKIKKAKIASGSISGNDKKNDAGELITGTTNDDKGASAQSNADLAAAVALKAMTRDGKFTNYKDPNNNNDIVKVQEAAARAVNKVLGVLNVIIVKTLQSELGKIKKN
ncbi:variable large family protein [Borrelia turicatae]|uniref:variable large family protein n=1 Tax=Borrelia turicatae TaxID=142 RepID=UPI001FF51906|nr:variable large family protein [Borrelia turicatae]UPA15695.1 variable large family protein [Borrelia turicatae]UPA15726.1 variable large family protein [Borrelia turicatae]